MSCAKLTNTLLQSCKRWYDMVVAAEVVSHGSVLSSILTLQVAVEDGDVAADVAVEATDEEHHKLAPTRLL